MYPLTIHSSHHITSFLAAFLGWYSSEYLFSSSYEF